MHIVDYMVHGMNGCLQLRPIFKFCYALQLKYSYRTYKFVFIDYMVHGMNGCLQLRPIFKFRYALQLKYSYRTY
jgi:hypothetical protein